MLLDGIAMTPCSLKLVDEIFHDCVLVIKHLIELDREFEDRGAFGLTVLSVFALQAQLCVLNASLACLNNHIIMLLDFLETSDTQKRDQDSLVSITMNVKA